MLSGIFTVIGSVVSAIVFYTIFSALNKSVFKVFVPIQEQTNKLKRKELISNIVVTLLTIICSILKSYYKLPDLNYAIFLGFSFALQGMILGKLETGKK